MTANTLRVLLVEDNPGDARLVRELLRQCAAPAFAVEHVTRLAEALERLARERFDVILLDLSLPDSSGLQGLGTIVGRSVEVPIIVVTGLDDEAVGLEALRAHASDYLVKGRVDTPTLTRSIRYAIERAEGSNALRESEHRYRSLFDGMTEGFGLHEVICDESGRPCDYRFLEVNQAFERMTGLRAADVVGRTFNEVLPGDDPAWARVFGEVALTGTPAHFENYSPALKRYYEAYAYRPAAMQFAVVFTDITERKRKEEELHDLNRTLSAHSKSDRAMMRAAGEAEYLKEVCRIVVEDCGHAMVWIGVAEEDEPRTVRPVAHAGFEEGYLETLRITWADTERGRGPTGTAIRTGEPVICRNMLTDPAFAPWREQALARGYASSIALPLESEGRTFGALTIYSRLPDPFSDAEVALLSSLADDLAYGISTLRTREAHARAEAALARSEQRYRSLVELSPEAILVSRLDAVEFANPAAVELFGAADSTQLVGRSPFDFFHPDTHDRMRQRIRQLQAGHVVAPVESRIVRLDGEVREVEVAAGPTEGAGGTAAQAILRDITERKRMENELRETRDYLENLFDHAAAPIVVWDRKYRITRFNRAFERLTGRRAADVIGEPLEILFPPARRAEASQNVKRAEVGEHWETVEIPILRVDGGVRAVLWNLATLFDAAGERVVATIAQGHDITERKQAEVERERLLREVEDERARLRTVIDTAPLGIVFTDQAGRVLLANPGADDLLNGAAKVGETLESREGVLLCRPDATPVAAAELPLSRAAMAGEVTMQVELLAVQDDGSPRSLLVSAAPILDSQGSSVGAVGVFQDITQRKRAEMALSVALAEARRRSEEVSGLLTAARAVLEHRDFSSAAGPIFECCRALIGAAAGYIAVHTGGDGDEEHVQVVRGGEPGAAAKRFAVPAQGSRREAYAARRPVMDNAVSSAAEWAGILPTGPQGVGNVLLVPMVIGDRVTGTLCLANKEGRFTDGDARLATAFAELAAVALLNSRTLDLLESHQEILEAQVKDRTRELREAAEALKGEVAERRLAEAEARFSEGRFRELFENVVAGVFEADPAREFLSVNRALVSMLGYRSSDDLLAALNVGAVWGEGGQFEDLWQRAAREGTLHGEEVALRRVDGSLLDGLLSISSVRDDQGTVLSYQGTVADVSALKRAERALEAERHRLRSILETMRDGVCIVGRDGAVEYVNRAMEEQFGLPDDQPCFEYVAGRSDRCPSCRHDEVLEGAPQSWELNVPATGRTYEVFATRLGTEDGSLSKLEIFHDVTERKEAEEAVRAERGRLFAVLDQLPVFVYLRRHDHAVVFANRHFREEFGDPEGRPCYETLNRCDSPCSGCDFARVFAGGETVEWEWAAPNGKSYQVHHYPFLDSDGARLVLALGVDVTERKLAYESEQKARGTAEALREASLALTKDLDVEAVLATFFGRLRRLVAFDAGALMLLEDGGSVLRVRATVEPGGRVALPDQPPLVIVMDDNPAVATLLAGDDARALEGLGERPEWAASQGMEGAHAWLGVPLHARGRAVGMYALARADAAPFTEDDRRLAEAVSAQAAASIENAVLFEQVQAASARLQALSRRLVDVQETERRAIARELHDEAGQSLTALLFGLRLLEKQVNGDDQTAQQIAELRQTTDAVMDDLHRLATDLHPASLEHLGLVPALQQHLAKVESQSGLAVRFMARGLEGARLPLVVETTVFRIAQEAVTNVLRHAHATRVDVIAERRGDKVVMVVEDDGVGFDPADLAAREGLGRVGMRERAEALGGTLTFETAPGAGTTVIVEVPSVELVTAT